jgi:required for meiotic nuclear division protein 1
MVVASNLVPIANLPHTPNPSIAPLMVTPTGWGADDRISVQARLVGERLVLKTIETIEPLATNPLVIRSGAAGCAVLLRYGVVVLFNLMPAETAQFLETLEPMIKEPTSEVLSEQLTLAFKADAKERIERDVLWLHSSDVERLQIVAEALAKSVVLEYYEREIAKIFDRMQVFAKAIQNQNARPPKEQELLRDIGGTLLIQQKMLGTVEVGEKPDPIWDHPELDRLYLRLEDEYELRERLLALEQKLDLIAKTLETALGILQRNSSHRVEWYIVILIVVEIMLSVYDLWIRPR